MIQRIGLIAVLVAGLGSALGMGCQGTEPTAEVDFGTPRMLVYVTAGPESGNGTVHVFERDSLEPVGTWTVEERPGEVRATPDGSLVWVVNTGSNSVMTLDTQTYEVTRLAVGVRPVHSYMTPGHEEIWVGNDGSASVTVLSVASRSVVSTFITGAGHHKMAFASDDAGAFTFGYVSNITDATITPVRADHEVRTNVPGVGASPHGMDYASSTTHIYNCSGAMGGGIEVVATRDDPLTDEDEQHTLVDWVGLPSRCSYLHVDEAGEHVGATLPHSDLFARLRLDDGNLETFPTCASPDKFTIIDDRVYVACAGAPEVSVIDLTGEVETVTVAVGHAVDPVHADHAFGHRSLQRHDTLLFVPNAFDGSVSVIDTTTDTVIRTWTGLESPKNIAVAGPSGGTAYPR